MENAKLSVECVRQNLAEVVPGFGDVAAESMWVPTAEFYKMLSAGGVTKNEVIAALAARCIALKRDN